MSVEIQLFRVAENELGVLLQLVGNLGEDDCSTVAVWHLKLVFGACDLHVKIVGGKGLDDGFRGFVVAYFLQSAQ